MRYKLTPAEYEKIDKLVKCALSAPNKAEARRYTKQIEYIGSDLRAAARNILHSLISSTNAASGQVQDKERLKSFAMMDLYKLKRYVEEDKSHD